MGGRVRKGGYGRADMGDQASGQHLMLDRCLPRLDTGNSPAGGVLCALYFVVALQVQPELVRGVEIPCQAQRSISGDSAPLANDLIEIGRAHV